MISFKNIGFSVYCRYCTNITFNVSCYTCFLVSRWNHLYQCKNMQTIQTPNMWQKYVEITELYIVWSVSLAG